MNSKNRVRKAGLALLIVVAMLTPVSIVMADDTTPPQITDIDYMPHISFRTDPSFYMYIGCSATDNIALSDVRVIITGPTGFTPINVSMDDWGGNYYGFEYYNVLPVSGTYYFYIWAADTSNNQAQSATYNILIFEAPMSTVHVDDSNTAGPWLGTATYPLQTMEDAYFVMAISGTLYLHAGTYSPIYLEQMKAGMQVIGDGQDTTIINGPTSTGGFVFWLSSNNVISNVTVQSSHYAIRSFTGSAATITHCTIKNNLQAGFYFASCPLFTITYCTIQNNTKGLWLVNSDNNIVHHNNFINNGIQVSMDLGSTGNVWSTSTIGNYWSDYRARYPNAVINPAYGTWNTPYVVNTTGSNVDAHAWVYPDGFMDTVPPQVTVSYPNGGETLTGSVTIQYTASDDLSPALKNKIKIQYSGDNGGSWTNIAHNLNNTGSYVWDTVSVPDGDQYLIKVIASDEFLNNGSDVSNSVFSIFNNMPPGTPDQPSGPTNGIVGVEYTYTTNPVTDPNGDAVSYFFDFGDGGNSGWISTPSATHTFTVAGAYNVKVKAKDTYEAESSYSTPLSVTITQLPELVIESITGGKGITVVFKNTGDASATNIQYTIDISGGLFVNPRNLTGTIETLAVGASESVVMNVMGIGLGILKPLPEIAVSAICDEGATAQASINAMILFSKVTIVANQ